jgi:hypothetical protein
VDEVIVLTGEPVTVTPGAGQVMVRWNAPGGARLTGYTVATTPRPVKNKDSTRGSRSVNASQTSCVITGLSNGATYDIVVTTAGAFATRPIAPVSAVIP